MDVGCVEAVVWTLVVLWMKVVGVGWALLCGHWLCEVFSDAGLGFSISGCLDLVGDAGV